MKIPSISELLDSPPLKPWVDKASRNVMLTSVKTFVTRMSSDLQSRAAEMKVSSVTDWAERIAEWIARREAVAPHAEINATGILLPDQATPPLADDALHALAGALRDYVVDRASGEHASAGQRQVAELAKQLTGAESCLVTGNHSAALLLALAATCHDRPVVIARGHVGEVSPGVTLPQIARSAGVQLRECGIVERARLADYEEAMTGAGAVLFMAGSRFADASHEAATLPRDLATICQRQGIPLIVDLGLGGIVDAMRYGLAGIVNASTMAEQGADLVVLAGDRLLGGPACGMIVGREVALQTLRKHVLHHSLAATAVTLLPLAATLQLHQDLETAERTIPLLSLLATSGENLKNRASRLAAQLSASPLVANATVQEATANLQSQTLAGQTVAAWEVVVEPRDIATSALAQRLSAALTPVAASVVKDKLHLNLRTVFPRHDMHIIDAFESLQVATQTTPEVNVPNEAE